jgi:hypothetical protein
MQKLLIILVVSFCCKQAAAQNTSARLDSLFFNLYTDSLKKGTFNYINVDGKFTDGRYLPLTAKELVFSCDSGRFEGNSLFIDSGIKAEKILVRVTLKSDKTVFRERTIYIKKYEDSSGLKTMEEVMRPTRRHL